MNTADSNTQDPASQTSQEYQNHIGKIIAVAGGKGGVGKTFVTGLLAVLLTSKGYRVGILDADFAASCIPTYFGVNGPISRGRYSFLPPQTKTGIKIISADFFLGSGDQKIVWKEALISNVVKELWSEMEWGELDYLLVDMPPANSEAAVTILQTIPVLGTVMVTTPQSVSNNVTKRSISLYQRMNVPIVGIVENMSLPKTPASVDGQGTFGGNEQEPVSEVSQIEVLSQLSFDPLYCELCDEGKLDDLQTGDFGGFFESFMKSVASIEEDLSNKINQQPENLTVQEAQPVEPAQSGSCVDNGSSGEGGQSFSDTVVHLIRSRENVGTLENPDGQGLFTGSCGDRMQIDLKIIAGRILDARFLADGCGVTYACGTMITKMAFAKKLDEANQITPDDLIEALDGLPDDHLHCAELAVMTLREAVIDAVEGHRNR